MGKLPTPEEVTTLLKEKIITNEEAREILFSSETKEDRDVKSLESEIKFLRELVDKLSQSRSKIVEVIKEVQVPYYHYSWYTPYTTWCGNGTITSSSGSLNLTATSDGNVYLSDGQNCSFTSIQTF